jgi:hypothetical protein
MSFDVTLRSPGGNFNVALSTTSGLNMFVLVSGSFKQVTNAYVIVSGAWKEITEIDVLSSGVWKSL